LLLLLLYYVVEFILNYIVEIVVVYVEVECDLIAHFLGFFCLNNFKFYNSKHKNTLGIIEFQQEKNGIVRHMREIEWGIRKSYKYLEIKVCTNFI